eukprot:gene25447-33210_t
MSDARFRGPGNGNSNARVLNFILQQNKTIESLDISNTGLDDDGMEEICSGISNNKSIKELNLSGNHFGEKGAISLSKALELNNSVLKLDVSGNALGYQSINRILCSCRPKGLQVLTSGNFVFEEILNSVSHGVAFIASLVGALVLIGDAADNKFTDYHFWACVLYSSSLMFLFLSSCLFHSFFMLPTPSRVLQVLDHVGIYLLIAGSYTPFLLIGLHHHTPSQVLLTAQWLTAFFGSIFSACSDLNAKMTTYVELIIFLVMGLGVLLVWPTITATLSYTAIFLLLAGGAAYIFVLGAALHWFDVYFFILHFEVGEKAVAEAVAVSVNILEKIDSFKELL